MPIGETPAIPVITIVSMINNFNNPTALDYAIENKSVLNESQIRDCETGQLFGTEFGKLPNNQFLLISRADLRKYDNHPEGFYGNAVAEFDLSPKTWFFAIHFHEDPVMPGTLQVEAVLQLAGLYLAWAGVRGVGRVREVGKTVFYDEIRPDNGSKFCFELNVKKIQGRSKLTYLVGSAEGFREDGVRVMKVEGIKLIKVVRGEIAAS